MSCHFSRDFDLKDSMKRDISKYKGTRYRSRSPLEIVESKNIDVNYHYPNRQFGDLNCVVRTSLTNFENSIKGKRFLKNSRNMDSSEQIYENENDKHSIQKVLDDKIGVINRLDSIGDFFLFNQPTVYQYFWRYLNLTTSNLLKAHKMGLEHQMMVLNERSKYKFSLLDSSLLNGDGKSCLDPSVSLKQNITPEYNQENGKRKIPFKELKKNPVSSFSIGNSCNDDFSDKCPRITSVRYIPSPKFLKYTSPKYTKINQWQSVYEDKVNPVSEIPRKRQYPDKFYSDKEKWKRFKPNYSSYRGLSTPLKIQDLRMERDSYQNNRWSSLNEGRNYCDLRSVIEQRKSLGMTRDWTPKPIQHTYISLGSLMNQPEELGMNLNDARENINSFASLPTSSETSDKSDKLLRLVDGISPEDFLWLTLFKLGNMDVHNDIEVKLLHRIGNKAIKIARAAEKHLPARK